MESKLLTIKLQLGERLIGAFNGTMLCTGILLFISAGLLSLFTPVLGVAPFGAACAAAAWYAGIDPYFACLGALTGSLISGNYGYALAVALYAVIVFLLRGKHDFPRIYRLLILSAAEAVSLLIFSGLNITSFAAALAGVAVSMPAAIVIGHGIIGLRSMLGGRRLSDTEQLTIAVTAGLLTLSFGNFNLLGQSPAMIFAGLCAVFAAYRFGASAVAVAVTVAVGRVLASNGDMLFIAMLAACTLIGASVRRLSKWATLAGFGATCILFTVFVRGYGVFSYFEASVICVVFGLVPERLYAPSVDDAAENASAASSNSLQCRISSLSEVLRELSRVYDCDNERLLLCVSDTLRRMLSCGTRKDACGVEASIGYAKCVKMGSDETGDSYAARRIDGRLLLAISDGMGSGVEARRESAEAIALLSDLISVGFSMDDAIDCVNRLLLKRGDGDMYATLDAAMLDLGTATVQLAKHGAPPSYVLRGGRVHSIYAEALPVGIIEGAPAPVQTLRLQRGDILIMMTDGVADALGRDLTAAIVDNVPSAETANAAANAILSAAKEKGYADDMTVMLAKIA